MHSLGYMGLTQLNNESNVIKTSAEGISLPALMKPLSLPIVIPVSILLSISSVHSSHLFSANQKQLTSQLL